MEESEFSLLSDKIRSALVNMRFLLPTDPQKKAIPSILRHESILLIAPTGSGKTEAALLPIMSNLLEVPERKGISVLYVTPHRALNRDIVERVMAWAALLGLTVEVRHGDTETKIRRKQALNPPDMLITTPETLQAILPGTLMRGHLSNVRFVIIDEVHEIAGNKRGAQLSIALERLRETTGRDFQRVGLSATVGNPDEVAAFIAGANRPIRVVEVFPPKGYAYTVEYPLPNEDDYELADNLQTTPEAASRIRRILDLIRTHTSTLVFVNSRTNAEMLGYKLGQLSPDVAVHHGSLSKEERSSIEDKLKTGGSKAIVCTSTLELGIDIGSIDLAIQYLSPRRVSTLIQRVGRSGHKLGMVSKGIIVTAFPDDTLEAIAAVRRARRNFVEPVLAHDKALDVLAHQIAGILIDKGQIDVNQAFRIIRRAYTYRNLSRVKFIEVVNYLDNLRELRLEGRILKKSSRTRRYYYENLSMIPDERRYPIVDVISDRKIGTLGDEFMALRARTGLNFICRGKIWKIVQIEEGTGMVYVVPSEEQTAAIPGWDGEMLPVPMSLAQEVGRLRHQIAEELESDMDQEKTIMVIAQRLSVEKDVISDAIKEVKEQAERYLPVPTNDLILIEGFGKYLVIHACLGEVPNWTMGCIFDAVLSDRELITGWWNDGYRILIEMPRQIDEYNLERMPALLFSLKDEDVDKAFQDYLDSRFPFAYKMKFVAERFGVLPRGKSMGPERLAQLPRRFKNTPVYEETLREAMLEKTDLKSVKEMMAAIKSGDVQVRTILTQVHPSPMAYNMLAKYAETPELMAPADVLLSNIEKMKKSIESRKIRLLCFSCGKVTSETTIRKLPERQICEQCGSGLLTSLRGYQDEKHLMNLLQRRLSRNHLDAEELKELTHARRVADMILSYGKRAVIALQVKGIGPETAFRILGKMFIDEDDFYMDLLKAKIQFLRTRQFWENKDSGRF